MDFVDLTQFRITTPFALPEVVPYSSGTADSGKKSHRVSLHVTTRALRIRVITTVTLGVRDLAGITRSPDMARKHRELVWQRQLFKHEQSIDRVLPAYGNHGKPAMQAVRQTAKLRLLSPHLSPVTCHFGMLSNLTRAFHRSLMLFSSSLASYPSACYNNKHLLAALSWHKFSLKQTQSFC